MRIRQTVVSVLAVGTLVAGCGGEPDVKPATGDSSAKTVEGKTPELENADLKKFFDAIAASDPEKMQAVKSLAAPGSIAAAYLQEQSDASNALIDAGFGNDIGSTAKEVDGGYKNCSDPADPTNCVTWADFESANGKLAKFTINGTDISDRIAVGDGSNQDAGGLATVEFLSAYKSVQSDQIFVNVKVTSHTQKINLGAYTATYRGDDKRQSTATDASAPTELDADSTAYVSMIFKASKLGGIAKLAISDESYNVEQEVAIKTS